MTEEENTPCACCGCSFSEELDYYATFGITTPNGFLSVPTPQYCCNCRLQRKLAWRNLRFLYRVPSVFSGKPIVSLFGPDAPLPVVSHEEWFSDSWNPFSYGRQYNSQRSFFAQLNELYRAVPWRSMTHYGSNENSEYCVSNYNFKNCYLTFWGDCCEDCINCFQVAYLKNCVDCVQLVYAELCYYCVNSHHLYDSRAVFHSSGVRNSSFVFDCTECSNCFLCVGLYRREYCFRNEQLSREDYLKHTAAFTLCTHDCFENCLKELLTMTEQFPVRGVRNVKCEDVSGNDLSEVSRMKNCYSCFGPMQDCANIVDAGIQIYNSRDLHGVAFDIKHCLDSFTLIRCQDVAFSLNVEDSLDVFYSAHCLNGTHLFGCCGLRRVEYCVLNTQYKPEEYWQLVARIAADMQKRGEWGEFLPGNFSPFAYDETLAQDYFPLSPESAKARGYRWSNIHEWDSVTASQPVEADPTVHICAETHKPFRVVGLEFRNLSRIGAPQPTTTPEVRLGKLIQLGSAPFLYSATCTRCGKACPSGFVPQRRMKILCQTCALESQR
jgi:hypothetical protein